MEVQSKGQKVCIRNTISSTNNNTLENPTNISNARLLTPSQMHAIVSHLCETRICLEGDRERKRGVQMVAFTPHQQTNEKKNHLTWKMTKMMVMMMMMKKAHSTKSNDFNGIALGARAAHVTRHSSISKCVKWEKNTRIFFFCFYPTNNFHCTICVRRRGLCVMCIWCAVRELMMFNQKLLRSSIEHTCYIYRRYILMMMSTMMMGVVERTRPIPSINRFVFIHCVCVRKIHQKWKCIRLRLFHLFFFFCISLKQKEDEKKSNRIYANFQKVKHRILRILYAYDTHSHILSCNQIYVSGEKNRQIFMKISFFCSVSLQYLHTILVGARFGDLISFAVFFGDAHSLSPRHTNQFLINSLIFFVLPTYFILLLEINVPFRLFHRRTHKISKSSSLFPFW